MAPYLKLKVSSYLNYEKNEYSKYKNTVVNRSI